MKYKLGTSETPLFDVTKLRMGRAEEMELKYSTIQETDFEPRILYREGGRPPERFSSISREQVEPKTSTIHSTYLGFKISSGGCVSLVPSLRCFYVYFENGLSTNCIICGSIQHKTSTIWIKHFSWGTELSKGLYYVHSRM